MSVVCVIDEKTLVKLSTYDEDQMRRKLRNSTFHAKMKVMRDLQIGLSAYSKKHKMDSVQCGLLATIQHVERIARNEFFSSRTAEVLRLNPEFLKRAEHMQTVKEQVAEDWRKVYRKYAY